MIRWPSLTRSESKGSLSDQQFFLQCQARLADVVWSPGFFFKRSEVFLVLPSLVRPEKGPIPSRLSKFNFDPYSTCSKRSLILYIPCSATNFRYFESILIPGVAGKRTWEHGGHLYRESFMMPKWQHIGFTKRYG